MGAQQPPTRAQANATPAIGRYWFGMVLGIALGLWLGGLSLAAVLTPNLGYGAIGLVMLAIFVGGPLAAALVITWIVYMAKARGSLPGRIHAVMFAPPLLAMCIVPAAMEMESANARRFSDAHPAIHETHVNLSGGPLWLAPDVDGNNASDAPPKMPMEPGPNARFVSLTRYPDRAGVAAGTFPYDGAHLRASIDTYTYGSSNPEGWSTTNGRTVPLVRLPYPDLHKVSRFVPEPWVLVHQYFHYGDHVEMAPSLNLGAASTEDALIGKVGNLVQFHLSNHVAPVIVRLEVNGQTLVLGRNGAIEANTHCTWAYTRAGEALVDLGTPLKLRWQTRDDPGHWHEASLNMPALRAAPRGAPVSLPSVLLYFTGKGYVAAERFQLFEAGGDRRALLASGLPASVPADETCGSAIDAFNPEVVTLLR
ncbi:hypothetical protein [Ralstonia sp. ASV6]|uniref:hypothetical protein n=1 Tax=Ralstonia sp. ASV6 TaxID=2795124 RepID=UPI0018EC95D0|nr:hypothetical protein [Ralstonia sp. ASV6]